MSSLPARRDDRAMSAGALLHPTPQVTEARDELVITLEVPGFEPEKLRIDLTDHTVTLRIPREPRVTVRRVEDLGFNAFATPC
jgi:HSP20 family molecular chaperone IbpA